GGRGAASPTRAREGPAPGRQRKPGRRRELGRSGATAESARPGARLRSWRGTGGIRRYSIKNPADWQTSSERLLRQGRQRAQTGDKRVEFLRLELAGGVLHHFSHRLGEDIPAGRDDDSQ